MEILLVIGLMIVFLLGIIIAFLVGERFGKFKKNREWENQVSDLRQDAVSRSRSVLAGQFSEQLAPYLPDFKYNPCECRFIGKPVDIIVFRGLDNKEIKEIVFLEIKSGDSKLSLTQKSIKNAIENGNVRWEEYKIPRDLTDGKD